MRNKLLPLLSITVILISSCASSIAGLYPENKFLMVDFRESDIPVMLNGDHQELSSKMLLASSTKQTMKESMGADVTVPNPVTSTLKSVMFALQPYYKLGYYPTIREQAETLVIDDTTQFIYLQDITFKTSGSGRMILIYSNIEKGNLISTEVVY